MKNEIPLTPETSVKTLPGFTQSLCAKLAFYDVYSLADLATKMSRQQLRQMRGVGEKTLTQIEKQLTRAGLTLIDHQRFVEPAQQPRLDSYQQQNQSIAEQTEAWVKEHCSDVWQARQNHEPGAFTRYVRAQLTAMGSVQGDANIKREFEHQLVRSLNRYEKQKRYAAGHEALKDAITSQARKRNRLKSTRN